MKTYYLILGLFLFLPQLGTAQVGINTTSPNAQLDIKASNQTTPLNTDGILIPKIDAFPATTPSVAQDGMLVFVTGDGTPNRGFYYWNHSLSTWSLFGSSVEKLNDLIDAKTDSFGISIFIGEDSGENDDGSVNQNVGIGFRALNNNTSGENNTALGYQSLSTNSIGNENIGVGSFSLSSNNSGIGNTAVGYSSLMFNNTGSWNTAIGRFSLYNNRMGNQNTAIGNRSLFSNTSGNFNVALGSSSLVDNTTGNNNTVFGFLAMSRNVLGNKNVAIGNSTLSSIVDSNDNVAIGYNAGRGIAGDENVFIGTNSGSRGTINEPDSITGSVFIGYNSGSNETNSNRLYIENSSSASPLIYGEFDNDLLRFNGAAEVVQTTDASLKVKTNDGNAASLSLLEGADFGFEFLYTGSNDKLNLWSRTFSGNEAERMTWLKNGNVGIGTNNPEYTLEVNGDAAKPGSSSWIVTSDRRLKQNIKSYDDGLETLLQINPVTFSYTAQSGFDTSKEHVGVIAQELQKIAPYMVFQQTKDGVAYLVIDNSAITYMLINSIQEQQKEIEWLRKKLEEIKQMLTQHKY